MEAPDPLADCIEVAVIEWHRLPWHKTDTLGRHVAAILRERGYVAERDASANTPPDPYRRCVLSDTAPSGAQETPMGVTNWPEATP